MNWPQFKTLLWLRWTLSRNRSRRGGALSKAVTTFIALVGVLAATGASIGGYFLGYNFPDIDPENVLLIADGIAMGLIFAWMIGFMVELQRSEMISIEKLLVLPVALKQVFFLNYLASLVSPSLVVFIPFLAGLSIGWASREPLHGLIFLGLAGSLVLIVTGVSYMVRGWLAALMANKRRKRAILVGVGVFAVVAGQVPNLILNNPYMRERREREQQAQRELIASGKWTPRQEESLSPRVLFWHKAVPPLWIGYGTMSLREGRPLPALGAIVAITVAGLLVLNRSYRSTMQVYLAAPKAAKQKRAAPAKIKRIAPRAAGWIEKTLPGVSEEVSVLTLGFVRSMWQSPEIKMALVSPLIIIIAMATMQFGSGSFMGGDSHASWKITGAVIVSMLSFVHLCSNSFGFERNGFRSLVLSPIRRSRILFAKNLSFLPLALGVGFVLLALGKLVFHFGWIDWIAGLLQLLAAFFLMSIVGNLASIVIPYRVNPGSLKPTKIGGSKLLIRYVFQLGSMSLLLTLFLPALAEFIFGLMGVERVPIYLISSAILTAAVALAYWMSLEPLGQLLHRRELKVLDVVTHEVE